MGPAVVLISTEIWLLQNLARKSQVSSTKSLAAPYSEIVLIDSCIQFSCHRSKSFALPQKIKLEVSMPSDESNVPCSSPCGRATTIILLFQTFVYQLNTDMSKWLRFWLQVKDQTFLVARFRGCFGEGLLRQFLCFWHAFAAMAADDNWRPKSLQTPFDPAQKLPWSYLQLLKHSTEASKPTPLHGALDAGEADPQRNVMSDKTWNKSVKNDRKTVLQRSSAAGIVPDLLRQDCSLAWPPGRLASPDQIEELEISLKRK